MKKFGFIILLSLISSINSVTSCQSGNLENRLEGFESFVARIMEDWNTPGVAIGIILNDRLAYSSGFGYRDLEKKLPVSPRTLFPIGSNTKLFTAVGMGLLVEKGQLSWDQPISLYVPQIKFYNDDLYKMVTLRDMMSHRTGISRHDFIWYNSDFSRKELFERLVYLEPSQPFRQHCIYNNLIFAAAGFCLELVTGSSWEKFIQDELFDPLQMNNTIFTVEEMESKENFAYPYFKNEDSQQLTRRPFYREFKGIGPACGIISNVEDISKWMIALMNQGTYRSRQVIPPDIIKETLRPAVACPNTELESKGHDEILNRIYGMGRYFAVYKGRYYTCHGGAIGGYFSQVSMMPYDSIGVIVLVNGAESMDIPDIITYNIYDRLLGLEQTDFNSRCLEERRQYKKAEEAKKLAVASARVENTRLSHQLSDFQGIYENPAYGELSIIKDGKGLLFDFHNIKLPLEHYHYNRFDTPYSPLYGKFSVSFPVNRQGDISSAILFVGDTQLEFIRKPGLFRIDPEDLYKYVGEYEFYGTTIEICMKDDRCLRTKIQGRPDFNLIPFESNKFIFEGVSDSRAEFILKNNEVVKLKLIIPSGRFNYTKKLN